MRRSRSGSDFELALAAGRALTGELDRHLKQKSATRSEAQRRSTDAGEREEFQKASSSKQPLREARQSPLAAILALRLTETRILLRQLEDTPWAKETDVRIGQNEEVMYMQTASAALNCLSALQGAASVNASLGSRDRKTIRTLCSLATSWGFESAILDYDTALSSLMRPAKLRELDKSAIDAAITSNFQAADVRLADLVSQACPLITLESQNPLHSDILSDQRFVSMFFGASLRIWLGPSIGSPQESRSLKESAQRSIAYVLQTLPMTAKYSVLTGTLAPRPLGKGLPPIPHPVRRITRRFLASQLLQREGIVSLISLGMQPGGSDGGDHVLSSTARMDRLVEALKGAPEGMQEDVFLGDHIIPTLISFLLPAEGVQTEDTAIVANVAAYALFSLKGTHSNLIEDAIQKVREPLLRERKFKGGPDEVLSPSSEVHRSLATLDVLAIYSPPDHQWLDWLISPVMSRLWSLLQTFVQASKFRKISEVRRNSSDMKRAEGLVERWLQIAETNNILKLFQQLDSVRLDQPRPYFKINETSAELHWGVPTKEASSQADLTKLMSQLGELSFAPSSHEALGAQQGAEPMKALELLAAQSNSTDQPSPDLFIRLLRSSKRSDVASSLLPGLLEKYVSAKAAGETDEVRAWHYLALISGILESFGEAIAKREQDSEHILRFIDICLGETGGLSSGSVAQARKRSAPEAGYQPESAMHQLLHVQEDDRPDTPTSAAIGGCSSQLSNEIVDEELALTAIELLLSVLENHSAMNPQTNSLLLPIESKLANLHVRSSALAEDLRRVVDEARVVLLSRGKQGKTAVSKVCQGEDGVIEIESPAGRAVKEIQEKYREALQALQDPILPVRAHGLVILRDMVSARRDDESVDRAVCSLLPDIHTIFMRTISDEDSYLYLNAIQGLKEVCIRGKKYYIEQAMQAYIGNSEAEHKAWTQQEVDQRLRVGESLLATVQKLSEAGAVYIGSLVPPLIASISKSTLPTALRSSIFSLLGTCVEAFPLAIAASSSTQGYTTDLVTACLDLLRIEMVVKEIRGTKVGSRSLGHMNEDEDDDDDALDFDDTPKRSKVASGSDDPTGATSSYPHLRRSAILLLTLLLRGTRDQIELWSERQSKTSATIGGLQTTGLGAQFDQPWKRLRMPGGRAGPLVEEMGSETGTVMQQAQDSPLPPLLFPLSVSNDSQAPGRLLSSTRSLAQYVGLYDVDSLVRRMANDLSDECDGLEGEALRLGLGAS